MFVLVFVLAGLAVYMTVGAVQPGEEDFGSKILVGTFDSRAVAIAYYRTETHANYINDLKAERAKAKAAGDEERVKELSAKGKAWQELANKQGFSTWPVDDILETIKGKLPEIAEQAGVDLSNQFNMLTLKCYSEGTLVVASQGRGTTAASSFIGRMDFGQDGDRTGDGFISLP